MKGRRACSARTWAEASRSERYDSYLRLIDSCITQLKAQVPSRTCNESKEEEKKALQGHGPKPQGQKAMSHPGGNPGANGWFL